MKKSYQEKIKGNHEIKLYQKNLCAIFQFYVIESPAHKRNSKELVSARGNSFGSYGWVSDNTFKRLKKSFKQASPALIYLACDDNDTVESQAEIYYPPIEYCSFRKNNSEINSLVRAIRNSFAHGDFYQFTYSGKKLYFLRNVHNGKLKAEMVLSEQTLLKWIEIIKAGPDTINIK